MKDVSVQIGNISTLNWTLKLNRMRVKIIAYVFEYEYRIGSETGFQLFCETHVGRMWGASYSLVRRHETKEENPKMMLKEHRVFCVE